MPREIHPDLLDCLRRANPYVEYRVEISAPDVGKIMRTGGQFFGSDLLTQTPAGALMYSVSGGLQLAVTPGTLANFTGTESSYDLNREDPQRRLKGVAWRVKEEFNRATLRTFSARVRRASASLQIDFALDIFRVTTLPGSVRSGTGSGPWWSPGSPTYRAGLSYTHIPLLSAVLKKESITWAGNLTTLVFQLSEYGLQVDNGPPELGYDSAGNLELPNYYFVVRPVNPPSATGLFSWVVDTSSSRTVAGVGTFERVFWARENDSSPWVEDKKGDVPNCKIEIDTHAPTSQAVYRLDYSRVPNAASTGRFVMEGPLPRGTIRNAEISYAGATGPWTAIKNQDQISPAQQIYWIRLTLYADANLRASPRTWALGCEHREVFDASAESIIEFPTHEIQAPWGEGSIPEARLTVIRF